MPYFCDNLQHRLHLSCCITRNTSRSWASVNVRPLSITSLQKLKMFIHPRYDGLTCFSTTFTSCFWVEEKKEKNRAQSSNHRCPKGQKKESLLKKKGKRVKLQKRTAQTATQTSPLPPSLFGRNMSLLKVSPPKKITYCPIRDEMAHRAEAQPQCHGIAALGTAT